MRDDRDIELINPDEDTIQAYEWDAELQKQILALLVSDRQFLLQSIDLIEPVYFANKAHQKAAKILFDHYRKYRSLPHKAHLLQELKDQLQGDKALLHHLAEIESVYEYYEPGLDARDYLSDKILHFAKMMAFRKAFSKSLKLLNKQDNQKVWEEIYTLFREAFNVDRNLDLGLEYLTTIAERYERMAADETDNSDKFKTGYKDVDEKIKGFGYKRGEMISVCADSGVGKSLMLTSIAGLNAKAGYKVCYITMELSQDRVAERFDAILTGQDINALYDQRQNVADTLKSLFENHPDKNSIIIKQFPSRACDTNTIRAYLNQLKFYGFKPDVLIVDYIGEMKLHPNMDTHASLELLVSELRGLGIEEELFVATAMQPNRSSKEAQKEGLIDESHLANGYGQVRPLDGFLTINQNPHEAAINLGRLYIAKQRFGQSKYVIWLRFDKKNLRIVQIGYDEYKNLMSKRKDKASKEIEFDKIGPDAATELVSAYDPSKSICDETNG